MKYFTKEHEWIMVDGDTGTVGISDYAQKQLGDVVYVSLLKKIGDIVKINEEVAEIESVKSVSPVYCPVEGKLIEFNQLLEDQSKSGIVNEDCYGKGWLFKISVSDKTQLNTLMDENKYNDYISTL
jgi:glycine cleavage system H protein